MNVKSLMKYGQISHHSVPDRRYIVIEGNRYRNGALISTGQHINMINHFNGTREEKETK